MFPRIYILFLFVVFYCVGCEPYGGMRSTYPAKDHDPRLIAYAQSLIPIIQALDAHVNNTGEIPLSLDKIPGFPRVSNVIYYTPEESGYKIGIKLGWDPSLCYKSKTNTWIFDPGDGTPEEIIKINVEQDG